MIIDIHLEVLDECQKGETQFLKEDFFEILVQEFMGSKFIKGEKNSSFRVPEEGVPKEQVPSLDSWFREEDSVPTEDVPKEQKFQVQIPGLRRKTFFLRNVFLRNRFQVQIPGFREEDRLPKECIPEEQVRCSDSGFRV
ncbi:SICA antigen [Plasmodium coatneyi]|uniref:SICA antigen n=1 Tax=Plasmodium coatneyi TaxID=208452 RepID=A0A1B1DT53_9APIC|nr:SICA antigen [Plasmodium coatneyi]ANQ05971.1 SICA antigen [Plasmodium coatneyi]